MKIEVLNQKLETLRMELMQAQIIVDDSTKSYLCNLEKLVQNYQDEIEKNMMNVSDGGNLGFRRAILEYDNLAEIDSLYDAACAVDSYYSIECKKYC